MESIELAIVSLFLCLIGQFMETFHHFLLIYFYIFFIYSFIMTHILMTVQFLNPDQSFISYSFMCRDSVDSHM
jgi:hypothetical membrane protein